MKEYQVTCVIKPNRSSAYEHITHLGEKGSWMMTREDMIRRIEKKPQEEAYFTLVNDKKASIGVVRGDGNKAPYLKTYANNSWNDNLLALAECDAACKIVS